MPPEPTITRKYRAFISYSHAADGRLAPALQSALQRFGKPWCRLRALRIFRDQTGLAATPELWGSIERALFDSEYLILLASPRAAASPWVQQEVEWWLRHKSADRLLLVLTEGELAWDPAGKEFDRNRSTALPSQLRRAFHEEPLHIDLRWAENEQNLSLRHPRFAEAVASLAATLHGKSLDDLIGEDVRQHTATVRLIQLAGAVLAVLTALAVFTAVVALRARRTAETVAQVQAGSAATQAAAESSRKLAQTALNQMADPSLAILLAAEAVRLSPTEEAVSALRQALAGPAQPVASISIPDATMNSAELSPDGNLLAVWSDKVLQLHHPTSGQLLRALPPFQQELLHAVWAGDGRWIATIASEGHIALWDPHTGVRLREFQHPGGGMLQSSPNGSRLLSLGSGGAVLWDPATGNSVAELECRDFFYTDRAVADFSPDSRMLAICARVDPVVYNAATGQKRFVITGHTSPVNSVSFAPNGTWLVTASNDRTLRKWRSSDGQSLGVWKSDSEPQLVRVSPDGKRLAIADHERSLTVRDAASGQVLSRMEFQPAPRWPLDFRFSPEGSCLAVFSFDGRPAEVRETRSGIVLSILEDAEGERRSLQFSADGKRVVVGNFGSPARLYSCELASRPAELLSLAVRRAGRPLTDDERARFLSPGTPH